MAFPQDQAAGPVVGATCDGLTEGRHLAVRLPADPAWLSVLRRRLADFLVAQQVGTADLSDLTVAVSEAAANAMEHPVAPAEPVIRVDVSVEGRRTVVATIQDSGCWRESPGSPFRGRGLALVRALVDEVTVTRTAIGTQVTLRRHLGK